MCGLLGKFVFFAPDAVNSPWGENLSCSVIISMMYILEAHKLLSPFYKHLCYGRVIRMILQRIDFELFEANEPVVLADIEFGIYVSIFISIEGNFLCNDCPT